ncbi:MAG: M42 family peptidase [Oscillospiraceae bacterium]|nr:M42 family peptidase [Oscillospiraceae bacterium]
MDTGRLTGLIVSLADARGVSGDESAVCELTADIMRGYTDRVEIKNGNVLAHFGTRGDKPHVLIDAHLDRVGLVVTEVRDDGFVSADTVGGLDMRICPAQRVVIHGRKDIKGVIATLPPHLTKEKSVMKKEKLFIDTGLSGEVLSGYVSQGDSISFDSPVKRLQGSRICGAALDDRCGIATIIKAVDDLDGQYDLPYSFTVMFSAQEELGERGACIGAYDIEPDIAIAVDVSFALSGGESPRKCGNMGGGCMIGLAPSLDMALGRAFIKYAADNSIPFQTEVMSGTTGTNADRFSVNKGGARALTLSIPLRYMHTPCEVIDVSDCENTAGFITAFLRGDING